MIDCDVYVDIVCEGVSEFVWLLIGLLLIFEDEI